MKYEPFLKRDDESKQYSEVDAVSSKLDEFLLQLKISEALTYAHKGSYNLADSLLSEIIKDHSENPIFLDMQARSFAQQGRINDAESLWKKALLFDPENIQCQNALKRIYEIQKRSGNLSFYFHSLSRLAIIIFSIIVIILLTSLVKNVVVSLSNLKNTQKTQAVILESLNNFKDSVQNYKRSTPNTPPNIEINISGINTKFEGDNLIVTFEKGLFDKGAELKPEVKNILTEFGTHLEPYASRIYIIIYGCTDDIPMLKDQKYSDNIALGKARASKVFEHFRETTNLPSDKLLIGSYGEYLPPFSNDTPEGRERNRTVVIRIAHYK